MTPELFHLTKAFTELYDKARYQPFNKSVQVFSQVQPSAGEFDRLMTKVKKKRDGEVRPEPAITLNRLLKNACAMRVGMMYIRPNRLVIHCQGFSATGVVNLAYTHKIHIYVLV